MARAVAVAALVLCAAVFVLVAAAHAGRVIEYQALEAGLEEATAALAPLAAASSPAPAPAQADLDVAADAGGGGGGGVRDGREARERGGAIADVLWFVLQWANEAAAGDRRKAY